MTTQTNNAAALPVTEEAGHVSRSALSVAMNIRLSLAIQADGAAGEGFRALLWDIVDAVRAEEAEGESVTVSEGEELFTRYIDESRAIAAGSRRKYKSRILAALTRPADTEGEGRADRDPLSWVEAVDRKAKAATDKAVKAKAEAEEAEEAATIEADIRAATDAALEAAIETELSAMAEETDGNADSMAWRNANMAEAANRAANRLAKARALAGVIAAARVAYETGVVSVNDMIEAVRASRHGTEEAEAAE